MDFYSEAAQSLAKLSWATQPWCTQAQVHKLELQVFELHGLELHCNEQHCPKLYGLINDPEIHSPKLPSLKIHILWMLWVSDYCLKMLSHEGFSLGLYDLHTSSNKDN